MRKITAILAALTLLFVGAAFPQIRIYSVPTTPPDVTYYGALVLDAAAWDSLTTGPRDTTLSNVELWKFSGASAETLVTSFTLPAGYTLDSASVVMVSDTTEITNSTFTVSYSKSADGDTISNTLTTFLQTNSCSFDSSKVKVFSPALQSSFTSTTPAIIKLEFVFTAGASKVAYFQSLVLVFEEDY